MTPDELRRMDNDLCIIYEKGIKPVKANKFYYFKHPMAKEMKQLEISHNDIGEIERGEWRKYNPYNPYVPESEEKEKVDNLKVESLDDLFDDIEEPKKEENNKEEIKKENNISEKEKKVENNEKEEENIVLPNDTKIEEAPVLPQEPEEDDMYDLQKEIEAKFDELFGVIDE